MSSEKKTRFPELVGQKAEDAVPVIKDAGMFIYVQIEILLQLNYLTIYESL